MMFAFIQPQIRSGWRALPGALLCLLLVLAFRAEAQPDIAGTVMFVHGKVEIIAVNGQSRSAERGAPVYSGESIRSGTSSSLQLKMVDDGYLAVRPSTEIRIDEYRFKGDAADKARTSLLRGGLRSITGSIGKKRKESFRLRTPVATIGIRGTDFEIFYQPDDQADLPRGAYLRVNTGRGYLQNYAGVQFVNPNQTGFVSTRSSRPVLLKDTPRIFNLPTTDIFSGDKAQQNQNQSQNDKNTRGDDNEMVDLNLPADLQGSRQQDDGNPVITNNSLPGLDIDLGVLDDATAPKVVDSQSGRFRYSGSNLTLSGFDAQNASASLDINFDTGIVGYQLDITVEGSNRESSSVSRLPAAAAASDRWLYSGNGRLKAFLSTQGMQIDGSYNGVDGADGYWYGIFTGDNADGLFTGFKLCAISYINGSCSSDNVLNGILKFTERSKDSDTVRKDVAALVSAAGQGSSAKSYHHSFNPVDDSSVSLSLDTASRMTRVYNNSNKVTVNGADFKSGTGSSAALSDGTQIRWGRWAAADSDDILLSESGNVRSLSQMHYITGDNLTTQSELNSWVDDAQLNELSSVEFALSAGTMPTLVDASGAVTSGNLDHLNLTVNLSSTPTLSADLQLTFDQDRYNATGTTETLAPGFGMQMNGSLSGNQIEESVNGTLKGHFVGNKAEGAIVSYDLKSDAGSHINGAALLKR